MGIDVVALAKMESQNTRFARTRDLDSTGTLSILLRLAGLLLFPLWGPPCATFCPNLIILVFFFFIVLRYLLLWCSEYVFFSEIAMIGAGDLKWSSRRTEDDKRTVESTS